MAKIPLKIFISYRQTDTGPEVRTLSDYLKEAFGRTMVFVDTANVRHGPKWPPQIQQALEAAGVLLVAVGPQWFDKENRRRLNEKGDWVRLEIARSLERDIKIIPVLINGAQRPNPNMLPPSIADIGKHLPMPLARENWAGQVRDLIDELVAAGCRRLPMRIILMDSHTKIYGRKKSNPGRDE